MLLYRKHFKGTYDEEKVKVSIIPYWTKVQYTDSPLLVTKNVRSDADVDEVAPVAEVTRAALSFTARIAKKVTTELEEMKTAFMEEAERLPKTSGTKDGLS